VTLICTAVFAILLDRPRWAGAALLASPLCGANGLIYVPPLVLWVGWRRDCVARALAVAALSLCAAYSIGWHAGTSYATDMDEASARAGIIRLGLTWPAVVSSPGDSESR
jgi:hypothetical protein